MTAAVEQLGYVMLGPLVCVVLIAMLWLISAADSVGVPPPSTDAAGDLLEDDDPPLERRPVEPDPCGPLPPVLGSPPSPIPPAPFPPNPMPEGPAVGAGADPSTERLYERMHDEIANYLAQQARPEEAGP